MYYLQENFVRIVMHLLLNCFYLLNMKIKKLLIIDTGTKETNPSSLWYINELEITEVPTKVNMKTNERLSYTDQISSINIFLE